MLDTLLLARERHPGQRNNLDALCKRYGIDNSHRELHGALLDARILADVYLAMTGGQSLLALDEAARERSGSAHFTSLPATVRPAEPLRVIEATAEERAAHAALARLLEQTSAGGCLWMRLEPQLYPQLEPQLVPPSVGARETAAVSERADAARPPA